MKTCACAAGVRWAWCPGVHEERRGYREMALAGALCRASPARARAGPRGHLPSTHLTVVGLGAMVGLQPRRTNAEAHAATT